MQEFKSIEAQELLSLAYYAEKISKKAERKMDRGKLEPENFILFKKLINELVSKNKEIISMKAVELLEINDNKRMN